MYNDEYYQRIWTDICSILTPYIKGKECVDWSKIIDDLNAMYADGEVIDIIPINDYEVSIHYKLIKKI